MDASDLLLQATGLGKRFGGLAAVDGVGLELRRGQVHCVIGPNGAGKSTLVNLLSGELRPDAGTIHLSGRDVTRTTAPRRSLLGLGRSFQKTNVFPAFSAFENVRLAAQSRAPRAWRVFDAAYRRADLRGEAERALAAAGLAARAEVAAGTLSHGEQRQLEIAMLLATRPSVLLLDEPLAGVGGAEAAALMALIGELKREHAILLIEHDMDAVFAVADRLTVMMNGRVLASGTPEQIRADAEVQAAYLGALPESEAAMEAAHG